MIEKHNETIGKEDINLDIAAISKFMLHYHDKYINRNIKFTVGENTTTEFGKGKYLMIVSDEKGFSKILEMFFLK
jgi:hypothetical protein